MMNGMKQCFWIAALSLTGCSAAVHSESHWGVNRSQIFVDDSMEKPEFTHEMAIQMMQGLLDFAFEQASSSGWKHDPSSPWTKIETFDMLAKLPRQGEKLAKIEVLREMIGQNYNFTTFKQKIKNEIMAHRNDHEATAGKKSKCKLNEFGQLQHMVEGNRWSSVDVPWLRLALFDVLELIPNYDNELDANVQRILSEFSWLFATERLSKCGWEQVSAQCIHESKDENGNRKLDKCRNENIIKNPLGYSRDKVMLIINKNGTEDTLFPPGSCAFVSHYLNDLIEADRYNIVDDDVKKWKKGDRSQRTTYEDVKTFSEFTAMGSGLKHVAFSSAHKELKVVRLSKPWAKLQDMMKKGECSKVIFTGFSLGGTVAEMARIDLGTINPDTHKYTGKCLYGVPCQVVSLASTAAFPFSTAPELEESAIDTTCSEGKLIPDFKDTMVFLEGDQEPARLDAYYFGYDIYPKNYSLTTEQLTDLPKVWPNEPGGYVNIKGMSIVEVRRDLIVHMKDGQPKAESCVYSKVAPCGMTVWDYFNTKVFTKRLQKIRKPLGDMPDGIFYSCLGDASDRFCGHRILAFDYWEYFHPNNTCGGNRAGEMKLPLAEGTRLQGIWNAYQIVKGILT